MLGAFKAGVMGAAGGGGGGDPYFANTTVIINHNGSITNESASGEAVTINNSVSINTSVSPFAGGSSLRFPRSGSGDYLSFPASNTITDFGTGDYTVEFWFNSDNVTNQRSMLNYANASTGSAWRVIYNENGALQHWEGPSFGSPALSTGTWYYVAVSRISGGVEGYLGASGDASATRYMNSTDTTNFVDGGNSEPLIGTYTGSKTTQNFGGYIAHVRITKGVGRYTGATIPMPTEAWPTE